MTALPPTGKQYVVVFHEAADGTPVLDHIDFTGQFSYPAGFTSTVNVQKDDNPSSDYDRFVVTYNYAAGDEPDLSSTYVTDMLATAVSDVNSALPEEVPGSTPPPIT